MTATELADAAGISRQTASGHLAKLTQARSPAVEKQGRHRYYRLTSPHVGQIRVDDLFVPQEYACSRDNPADRREPGLLYRFTSGMIYAMGFSNVSLGVARGALEAFIELACDSQAETGRKFVACCCRGMPRSRTAIGLNCCTTGRLWRLSELAE